MAKRLVTKTELVFDDKFKELDKVSADLHGLVMDLIKPDVKSLADGEMASVLCIAEDALALIACHVGSIRDSQLGVFSQVRDASIEAMKRMSNFDAHWKTRI